LLVRSFAALCLVVWGMLDPGSGLSMSVSAAEPVYELRIYNCEPGKLSALNERFRNHTLKLFERHGMKNVAYFVPTEGAEADSQLIYLLEHASREAAEASWKGFRNDPEWKQVAAESQQAHGKILSSAPTSIFLTRTDYSPEVRRPAAGKTYELRTYIAADGKLDALNARFRDHTVSLFKKHGMTSYGYWTPSEAPASQNTLIYLLEHDSRDSAEAGFTAFRADPDWIAAKSKSEANGALTAQKPTSQFLKLVPYSPQE